MVLILKPKRLIDGDVVAADTEGTGLSPWKGDRPWAFSFCNADGETRYVEFPVDKATRQVRYSAKPREAEAIRCHFRDRAVSKVFWNAKYDVRMIRFGLGLRVAGPIHEAMFAAHCCNPCELTYALKPWAKKYAGYADEDQDELQKATVILRRKAKEKGWKIHKEVEADYWLCMYAHELLPDDPETAERFCSLPRIYAVGDAERTMLGWLFCERKMEELRVRSVYDEEMKLWPAVMDMEDRGVRVDRDVVAEQRAFYQREHDAYYKKLMELGEEARMAGSLDTRGRGLVLKVDRLKSGKYRRFQCALMNRDTGEVEKAKWFKAEHCKLIEGSFDSVGINCVVEIHEPFKQKQFNPGSDEQLAKLLYDHLRLPVPENVYRERKKKTMQRPVDADTLLELSASTEIVDDILMWRAAGKALDFYDAYELGTEYDRDSDVYVLHADFNQCGPRSGRFSCRRPNLQQAASKSTGRSAKPIDTRAPFGPRPGHVWYSIDYSQLEPRIFASLSQEPEMLRIIRSGQHIHKACADHVWGFRNGAVTKAAIEAAIHAMGFRYAGTQIDTPQQVALRNRFSGLTDEQAAERWLAEFEGSIVKAEESIDRKNSINKAKLAIFTRLYGGGIPSIMNLMKCTREEAQTFLKEYGEAFPAMDPWMKQVTREARREGCTWTAFGRRIVIDDLDKAYRAVNYKIQGSAADLMKRGMRACYDYIRSEGLKAWIVMTIHDELVFEFDVSQPRMRHVKMLQTLMEDHGGVFDLPMTTKCSVIRQRWSESKEIQWTRTLIV
jgi:DNA polymerase I-like protein with 3'-5' exonuclease and polymerase domains